MDAGLLRVEGLRVAFPGPGGEVAAVRGVSFSLDRGETLGLVGESGCGKSVTALSVLGLVPPPGPRLRRPGGLRRPRAHRASPRGAAGGAGA